MHGVDFDAVHPGVLAHLGGAGEGFHDMVNFLHREGTGHDPVRPAVGGGGGAGQDEVHIKDGLAQGTQHLVLGHLDHQVVHRHGPAEARGQLDEQLGPGLVEFIHEFLELAELARVLVQPPAAQGVPDGGNAGQDQTHVVFGPLQQEVGRFLVKMVGLHPSEDGSAAHGTQHDAVLDLAVADLPGGKQYLVFLFHLRLLCFSLR